MSQDVLDLCKALINRESVTPEDAGCQQLMADILEPLGFIIETMVFDNTFLNRCNYINYQSILKNIII
mgnify:CR=1 FL=1